MVVSPSPRILLSSSPICPNSQSYLLPYSPNAFLRLSLLYHNIDITLHRNQEPRARHGRYSAQFAAGFVHVGPLLQAFLLFRFGLPGEHGGANPQHFPLLHSPKSRQGRGTQSARPRRCWILLFHSLQTHARKTGRDFLRFSNGSEIRNMNVLGHSLEYWKKS